MISLPSYATTLKNDLASAKYLEGETIVCVLHPDLAEVINKDFEALAYLKKNLGKEIVFKEDRQRKWGDYQISSY